MFTIAENNKYKETESINSAQSHPLWVTLYDNKTDLRDFLYGKAFEQSSQI